MKDRRRVAGFFVSAMLFAAVWAITGCASRPPDLAPGEEPVVEAVPGDGVRDSDEPVDVTIDLGGLGDRAAAVEISIQDPTDERPVRQWYLPLPPGGEVPFPGATAETTLPEGATPLGSGRYRVAIPLTGLEDGRRYLVRYAVILDNGDRYPLASTSTLELRLGLPIPAALETDLVTLDRRQPFRWSLPDGGVGGEGGDGSDGEADGSDGGDGGVGADDSDGGGDGGVRGDAGGAVAAGSSALVRYRTGGGEYLLPGDDPAGPVVPGEDLVDATVFAGSAVVPWQVRIVSPRGVLGGWSPEAQLRFDLEEAVPTPRAHVAGLPSVTAIPGLSWNPVAGARRYRLQVWLLTDPATDGTPPGDPADPGASEGSVEDPAPSAPPPAELPVDVEIEAPVFRLDTAVLGSIFAESGGRTIGWRVAALGDDGVTTPFSDTNRLVYAPIVGGVETILPRGAAVELVLGSDDAPERDERPAATVTLTRSFAMTRHELTNAAVAGLVASEVAAGRMIVADGAVRDADDPERVLIGLGQLDFGSQFGLVEDDGAVGVAEGYESHPAVGVSWHGAVALADALSILEGRSVSRESGDDGKGYRLPTEAEWSLAVSLTRRLSPEETRTVVEARRIGAVEMRGINHERSGDRWEDPTPPFTRSGGPTSAVGALGFPSPSGVSDLLGNVWEWTADWYDPEWYATIAAGEVDPGADPSGPPEPPVDIYGRVLRSVRGTAWNTPQDAVRPGNRGGFAPDATSHSIGVRLVRTLP
jgi:formylglycine-generating enzyme required for sulfatase activity